MAKAVVDKITGELLNHDHVNLGGDTVKTGFALKPSSNSTTAIQLQDAAGTNILNIDTTNSRVGIGTTGPGAKLELVNPDTASNIAAFLINNQEESARIGTLQQSGADVFVFTTTGTNTGIMDIKTGGSTKIELHTNGDSYFNGGNVGIGTTGPRARLDIGNDADGIVVGHASNVTNTRIGRYYAEGAENYIEFGGNYDNYLAFGTADTGSGDERVRITKAGNVGIGTTTPNTTLHISGGVSIGLASKTATYTMLTSDCAILADATTAAFTVTLPSAANTGMLVHIKKTDSSANAVTVSRAGTDTIEGATTTSLASQYSSITLVANGSSLWVKIAST